MKTQLKNIFLCSIVTLTTFAVSVAQADHVPHIGGTYRSADGHIARVVQNSSGITLYYQVPGASVILNAQHGQCDYTAKDGNIYTIKGFHGFFRTMFDNGNVTEGCCRIFPTTRDGVWEIQTYLCENDRWVLSNTQSLTSVHPVTPPAPDWDHAQTPRPAPVVNNDRPLSEDYDEFQLLPSGLGDLGI